MSLHINDLAPDATLLHQDNDGIVHKVKLSDMIGGRRAVVLFFPAAGSDTCTEEMCTLTNAHQRYNDLDATVVGISVDSPFAQRVWAQANEITIPLLSDFNKVAAREWGVYDELWVPGLFDMEGVAKRSVFVIDPQGRIVHNEVLDDARLLPDYQAIERALAAMA